MLMNLTVDKDNMLPQTEDIYIFDIMLVILHVIFLSLTTKLNI